MDLSTFHNQGVTGQYMYDLLTYWRTQGYSRKESEIIGQCLDVSLASDLFTKVVGVPVQAFRDVSCALINNFVDYEEVPAWQEVCLLRIRLEDGKLSATNIPQDIKTLCVCVARILPMRLAQRHPRCDPVIRLCRFTETPSWYRAAFDEYRARHLPRLYRQMEERERSLRSDLAPAPEPQATLGGCSSVVEFTQLYPALN